MASRKSIRKAERRGQPLGGTDRPTRMIPRGDMSGRMVIPGPSRSASSRQGGDTKGR